MWVGGGGGGRGGGGAEDCVVGQMSGHRGGWEDFRAGLRR